MRKVLKTFLLFFVAGIFVVALSSCKKLTITVETSMKVGQTYTLAASTDATWTSSNPDVVSISGNKATAHKAGSVVITATAGKKSQTVTVTVTEGSDGPGDPTKYQPKWDLNSKMNWDGKGMVYRILVSPLSEYDPFEAGFTATGNGKIIKQNHMRLVEQAYNIDIQYFEWATLAKWGPERVSYINENYLSKEIFTKDEAYVVQIACSWIPTLVKNGSLASLYNMSSDTGFFTQVNGTEEGDDHYIQNSTYNQITSVNNAVYGYTLGAAHADQMIYYNIDLVKEMGMTDPVELWFKGEWTLSNFDKWIQEGQTNIKNTAKGKFVLDIGYPEFTVGLVASTGNKLTNSSPANILFTRPGVTNVIDKIQSWYKLGYYNNHGVADVTTNFLNGETVLHSGSIWFLRNKDRFNPEVITFKIGAVPYPTADGQGGTPILTTDAAEALETVNGEPLTDADGNYISGVDMSGSTFQVPFTDGSCYSILNVQNGKNGITSEIAFHILHDLMAAEGPDPSADVQLTPEEAYKNHLESKLDYPIHAAAILSTENNMYYEMIEIVSMTVGNGSHFGENALWKLIPGIITKDVTARTELNAVLDIYKAALRQMGYAVA